MRWLGSRRPGSTDAKSAIERGQLDGWTVGISGLTYETTGTGDHLTLRPLTFKIEGTAPVAFVADASGIADPSLPTVVSAFDGSGYALVPPGQVPATIDGLHFTDIFPAGDGDVEGGHFNFTSADTDGNITPLVFPSEPTTSPEPFTIERADGCTTATGAASAFLGLSSDSTSRRYASRRRFPALRGCGSIIGLLRASFWRVDRSSFRRSRSCNPRAGGMFLRWEPSWQAFRPACMI